MVRFVLFNFLSLTMTIVSVGDKIASKWENYTGIQFSTFGFQAKIDSTINSNIDKFIIQKVRDTSFEYGEDKFANDFKVFEVYYYPELPCVKRYSIMTPGFYSLSGKESISLLINVCDSSFYYFNGNVDNYYKVVSNILKQDLNKDNVLNIISLYLQTVYTEGPFYILDSSSEVDTLVHKVLYELFIPVEGDTLSPGYRFRKNADREVINVQHKVKPIRVDNINGGFEVELYTFDMAKVECWRILVTSKVIRILERDNVAIFIPYEKVRDFK